MMALKLVTAPSDSPITLDQAKAYLRVDDTSEDLGIIAMIAGATAAVENFTGRKLMPQTWDCFLDAFPTKNRGTWFDGVREMPLSELEVVQRFLTLKLYPVQSVTFIKTFDDANTEYEMPTSDYFVDTKREPARVALANSAVWPSTVLRPVSGIQIRAVCGYASAAVIPQPLKDALYKILAHNYEHRGDDDVSIPSSALALMQPYGVMRL